MNPFHPFPNLRTIKASDDNIYAELDLLEKSLKDGLTLLVIRLVALKDGLNLLVIRLVTMGKILEIHF